MPEINLLPDELRQKEQRELESVRKKPKVFNIEMSRPQKEEVKQPLRTSQPSFFTRLFSKKEKPAKVLSKDPKNEKPRVESKTERTSKKVLHIPKIKPVKSKPLKTSRPSFFTRLFSKKEKPGSSSFSNLKMESEQTPELDEDKTTEKVLHIPKVETIRDEYSPDLLSGNISATQKEIEKHKEKVEDKFVMPGDSGISVKKIKEDQSPSLPASQSTDFKLDKIKSVKKKSNAGVWWKVFTKWKGKKDKKSGKEDLNSREGRLDVNLIPEELAKKPEIKLSKKLFISGLIIFISILLIVGGYLGISYYQFKITEQIEELEVKIANLNKQIAQYEEGKSAALALQQRLETLRQLLDNHVYWTQFFDLLEKYTISEVYYTNFSMAGKDKLSISAVGKDYNSVAKQLLVFQNAVDFVANVRIDAASAEVNQDEGGYAGVSFSINLEFLPGVFLKPIE